ncbi:hypothetical protein [Yoonia sp. SS1-5]|uniref:Calcium-binding protein n=1 Tax=Yoonia rhodophyticola TaxID=3137370 RepID=A0AAN0M9P0_9RHOB
MDLTMILLLVAGGALLVPLVLDDDEDSEDGPDARRIDGDEIRGTFGDDTLDGTDRDDLIFGFTGDDVIDGGGGDDEIRPGEGNDTVNGGLGRDFILGSPGNDVIDGGVGDDRIFGGADDDIIQGGFGSDLLRGGDGNDVIAGGLDARSDGGPAERVTDALRGDDGDDTLFIWGGEGRADGSADDDDLILVTGEATLVGGAGDNDHYVLANVSDDQDTNGIISDFDPVRDTLTLTVDGVLEAGDVAPTLRIETVADTITESDGDGGTVTVSGIRVTAVMEDSATNPDDTEGASVFLRGATQAQVDAATIDVFFTEEADIENPTATLASFGVTVPPTPSQG